MKKIYAKPQAKAVKVATESVILQGSATMGVYGPNTSSTTSNPPTVKSYSID